MKNTRFIQLLTDYGTGDPAFGEVIQKLAGFMPDTVVNPTSVPAFSTIATGFWTYQYATVNPVPGMVIYTNTAPRKDKKDSREKNEGERLIYANLKNGVTVIGVNAGFCFSFIKPLIKSAYFVNVANRGSQFRSRDFYPEAVTGIIRGETAYTGDKFDVGTLPSEPENRLAWIDGYGNLKTTVRYSKLNMSIGQSVLIILNGIKRTAAFTDGTFSVYDGQLAFAPGSSGGEDRFMEILLRGLSAWQDFGKPRVEDEFSYIPVNA